MKKFNKFYCVYSRIKNRHPDWSKAKLRSCTMHAISGR